MTFKWRRADSDQTGFTVFEVMVASTIMTIVLAVTSSFLISLTNSANNTEAIVAEEQAESGAMAQLQRDIKSAASVSFPSGSTPANEVELADYQANGSTTNVLWTYVPTTETLTRQVQSGSSFTNAGPSVSGVANPSGTNIFSYYDYSHTNISSTSAANIAICATDIGVDLYVASGANGVANMQESEDVALTNQLDSLIAAGNQSC